MTSVEVKKIANLAGHRDCIYTLEEVPENPIFFSGSGDGMIVQWDLRHTEGERVAQMGASVYALRYVKSSGVLIAGHNFEGIHLLDWKNKKEIGSLRLTTAAIFDIRINGPHVIVAGGEGAVFVIDYETLNILKRLEHSEKSARAIALNPNGMEMAVGYSDNHIRIFRLSDYSLLKEYQAHGNSIFTLQYSPDGQWLLSGSRDARLKVWKSQENYALHQEIAAHLYAVNDIQFSPDGKHFVTCSMDKSVKVWRTKDLTLLKVIDKSRHAGHGTSVNKLLWGSFNQQVVSASDDRTISIWDVIF